MTNKEAIKYLIRPFANCTNSYNEYLKQKEAYELAIKALNTLDELGGTVYRDMDNLKHTCYTLSRNSNRCDVCGAPLPNSLGAKWRGAAYEKEEE